MMKRALIGLCGALVAGAVVWAAAAQQGANDDNNNTKAGAPTTSAPSTKSEEDEVETKTAVFGGGCFWGVELRFSKVEGVVETEVGYMGGSKDHPTYKEVCTDKTGHAEVVKVVYDPEAVTYDQLLEVFWHVHDPTQVNRQGPDFGTQYRTVIFYTDEEQREQAEKSKAALQASEAFKKRFGDKKIATQIVEATTFWPGEEYHQDYLLKHGQETCHVGW